MMKHRPLVFLDIETTGGSARTARITDIGALRVENGRVVARYNQLINPEVPIPPFITSLTGISNEMVWAAPTFKAIAADLQTFLDGAVLAAHYVQFDYSFIVAEYNRLGVSFATDRLCTVRLDRLLYPKQPRHGLDQIIERLDIRVAHRHRGYDDAQVLWKFFSYEYARDELNVFRQINHVMQYARRHTNV